MQCKRLGFNPGSGRSPGVGNGTDRGAWWATVRGVAESDTIEHAHRHHVYVNPKLLVYLCLSSLTFPLWEINFFSKSVSLFCK